MPELPDIVAYLDALETRVLNQRLEEIRILSPFVLRSVSPPVSEAQGKRVLALTRMGKRIVFELEDKLYLVIHLMIAGRLHWKGPDLKVTRQTLLVLRFQSGLLTLTEAGSKRRASLRIVKGEDALADENPGGLEVLDSGFDSFRAALARENHTLKRTLTDPHVFSGIGNAYSDEILHRAGLSPFHIASKLGEPESRRLYEATREVLTQWMDKLRGEAKQSFPEKVTAFREGMSVHGRYRQPCPKCGTPIQRIVYAANEANYCPTCQTAGRLLADRALSRLLKEDWPRTIEELEHRRSSTSGRA